jgi:uncharacterized protein YlxP (DUF503 family)
MTNEEMERAIDFLLKSQANIETQHEQTNRQIAETNKQIAVFADIQADMMRVMTRTFEEQARINESQRDFKQSVRETYKLQSEFNLSVREAHKLQSEFNLSVRESNASQRELNEALGAALARLAESQAHTDRRLDALIDIVRGERNGG